VFHLCFCSLYLIFNKMFYSASSNLHRHPYSNATFGFPSSRYVPYDFLSPLYLDFNKMIYLSTPNLHRHPYANTIFGFPSSRHLS